MKPPLVSVFMITYNHELYIAQAIESVMMQKTKFDIELVIGEDCSTDFTRKICLKYKAKYPTKIKLILHSPNIGAMNNTIQTLQACDGKYVACLEGDDYWTDPLKLQKQIDFLEAHPSYAICAHDVSIIKDNVIQYKSLSDSTTDKTFTIEDLAKANLFSTLSVVFKNGLIDKFPAWMEASPIADYVLHMLNAKKGKIKYMADNMAVYRLHSGGAWSELAALDQNEKMIRVLSFLITEDFDDKVIELLKIQKSNTTINYLQLLLKLDRELLKTKLDELSVHQPELKDWLLNLFIDEYAELLAIKNNFNNLKNSRLRRYLSYFFKQLHI